MLALALLALLVHTAAAGVVIAPNVSNPEQYATVLAWDQWVPSLPSPSPFYGILWLTVTPIIMDAHNLTNNTYRIDTYLFHDVPFAMDASVFGPAPRNSVDGSMRLFHLFYLNTTAESADCPQSVSVVVSEQVIIWLRQGLLFAEISSNGVDGGQLRGQIETRNDLYFCALGDLRLNRTLTGAVIVRGYTVSVHGVLQTQPYQTLGIDLYVLSQTEWGTDFVGTPPNNTVPAINFGSMPSTVVNVNQLYGYGLYVARRDSIEKQGALFGPNSSNMRVLTQSWDANYTYVYEPMCDLVRLPLLGFSSHGRGNNILIYKPLY
jgi:hypothetical protein